MRKVCIDCYRIHLTDKGLLEPIEEEEEEYDTQSDFSDFSEEREREAPANPFYDERYDEEEDNIDSEDREAMWEMYWYSMENFADF